MDNVTTQLLENGISCYSFGRIVLDKSNTLKDLRDCLKVSTCLNDLSRQQIIHLKLMYKWINDEQRFEKIFTKDALVLERSLKYKLENCYNQHESRYLAYYYKINDLEIEGRKIKIFEFLIAV